MHRAKYSLPSHGKPKASLKKKTCKEALTKAVPDGNHLQQLQIKNAAATWLYSHYSAEIVKCWVWTQPVLVKSPQLIGHTVNWVEQIHLGSNQDEDRKRDRTWQSQEIDDCASDQSDGTPVSKTWKQNEPQLELWPRCNFKGNQMLGSQNYFLEAKGRKESLVNSEWDMILVLGLKV